MKVLSVYDDEFKQYGKILYGYELRELMLAMEAVPMPETGTCYEPCIDAFEKTVAYESFSKRAYGGLPIQLGMCWGYNTKLNCLEYHKSSEINMGIDDFILLLAKQTDIVNGRLDSASVIAFKVPAGVPVELFATTMHYAPCNLDSAGFRVMVVLPKGTNLDRPDFKPICDEDRWLTACNKWLLAHESSSEAAGGAYIGLTGKNLDIIYDI